MVRNVDPTPNSSKILSYRRLKICCRNLENDWLVEKIGQSGLGEREREKRDLIWEGAGTRLV